MTNSKIKFHLFFIITGIIAAVGQVVIGYYYTSHAGVIGASGAIFALMGYSITGNFVTYSVLDSIKINRLTIVVLFIVFAAILTFLTASEGIAIYAHGIGLLLGLFAGYFKILH